MDDKTELDRKNNSTNRNCFPVTHNKFLILSRLLIYFGSLHYKQYRPWSECLFPQIKVELSVFEYSKTCLKRPLKNRQNKGLNGKR